MYVILFALYYAMLFVVNIRSAFIPRCNRKRGAQCLKLVQQRTRFETTCLEIGEEVTRLVMLIRVTQIETNSCKLNL